MAENRATPTKAKPTSTTAASHGLLKAANPAAAQSAVAIATSRARAVANSPIESE